MGKKRNKVDRGGKYAAYDTKQYRDCYGSKAFYPPKFWTPDEDIILINWYDTDGALAEVLKRSIASIRKRRHRLKNGCGCTDEVLQLLIDKEWI